MRYFTSDWHLNEKRIGEFNPFFRPFKSIEEQNNTIINNMNSIIKKDDTLIHIGDIAMDLDGLKLLDKIKCKDRTLIRGNYDIQFENELSKYFDRVIDSGLITIDINSELKLKKKININGFVAKLNHYPTKIYDDEFGIFGHIHGLWKVQPNMVNVSVDAWHFNPVSEFEIIFIKNAIENGFYDDNVFPKTK